MDFWTNAIRDSVLGYGRITYQLMVPYWPDIAKNPSEETKTDIDFANYPIPISANPKITFTSILWSLSRYNFSNHRVHL